MRAIVVVFLALAAALAAAAPGAAEPATPPPDSTVLKFESRFAVPPPAREALGTWSSDADPAGLLMVKPLSPTALQIHALGRFIAIGFVQGAGFVGLAQMPDHPGADGALSRFLVLRIPDLGRRPLEANFADDLAGEPTRREIWSLGSPRIRRPGDEPSPQTPDDSLPRFGEYVYVEELPEAVHKIAPDYPEWARKAGVQGTVMIQALVGKDGRILDTRIVRSIPDLDDYAVAAVKQWRFKPALSKGKPVAVWVAVPVKFTLH